MRYFAFLLLLIAAPAVAEQPLPPQSHKAAYAIGPGSTATYEAEVMVLYFLPFTIRGNSGKVAGSIGIDGAGSCRVNVDAASFSSGHDKRDKRVREILETGRFPTVEFVLASVGPLSPDDPSTYAGAKKVRGNLTIRGITKEVSFPGTVKKQGESYLIDGGVELKYADFGVQTPAPAGMVSWVADHLLLKAHLVAVPAR